MTENGRTLYDVAIATKLQNNTLLQIYITISKQKFCVHCYVRLALC